MGHTIEGLLSRIQQDQRQPERDPSGQRKETLGGVRQWATRTFTTLADQVKKIRDDTSLSAVGQRQRLAELAKKTDLSFLASKRTETEADVARLRTLLVAVPRPTGDPVLTFLREQELRSAFKDKPQHAIAAAYHKAVAAGQHELVRALTEGPAGSLVEADFKTRVEIEHAETAQPAVFANYEEAQNLQEHLNSLETHATRVLAELPDSIPAPARAVA
jgi:hypothetical protein